MTDHTWPVNGSTRGAARRRTLHDREAGAPAASNRAARGHLGREDADPYCLRSGEAAELLAGHPWRRLAILGDSVAAGVGDPAGGYSPLSFPDRLVAELSAARPGLVHRNLGQRDRRVEQVHAEQLAPALAFTPDLALVVCGANNALSPRYAAAAVDVELAAMVTSLRAGGADVITVSTFVLPAYPVLPGWLAAGFIARMRTLAAHTRALAGRLDTIHVDLEGHPVEGEPGLHSADGLHGNGRTQAIAAALTIRRLGLHLRQHLDQYPGQHPDQHLNPRAEPDLAADTV